MHKTSHHRRPAGWDLFLNIPLSTVPNIEARQRILAFKDDAGTSTTQTQHRTGSVPWTLSIENNKKKKTALFVIFMKEM